MTKKFLLLSLFFLYFSSLAYSAENNINNVTDLPSGFYSNGNFAPQTKLIESAEHTIDIEIYEMYDPSFQQALLKAIDRKVKVRVIKEPLPIGDSCNVFEISKKKKSKSEKEPSQGCLTEKKIKEAIETAGGSFVPFKKENLCGQTEAPAHLQCVQHGKMIIIDKDYENARAVLSTGNFNDSSFCNLSSNPFKCNRDYSYIISEKPTVSALVEIFEKDLVGERYDLASILEKNKNLTVSPFSKKPIIDFIKSAKKKIQIQNQYIKDPEMLSAIRSVANRKENPIEVEVMVASMLEFSKKLSKQKNLSGCCMFSNLDKFKVNMRFYTPEMTIQNKHGYLHAKAIVVDPGTVEAKAWLGSVNGSTQSLIQNREFGIFFNNPKDVASLSEIMHEDYSHPLSVAWSKQFDCAEIKEEEQCKLPSSDSEDENE
jgi:phosphatidylserine/phosphatidylglycerophosphate/cardiolipin synthase-like enzyme